jgi:hypothetical protein
LAWGTWLADVQFAKSALIVVVKDGMGRDMDYRGHAQAGAKQSNKLCALKPQGEYKYTLAASK